MGDLFGSFGSWNLKYNSDQLVIKSPPYKRYKKGKIDKIERKKRIKYEKLEELGSTKINRLNIVFIYI